MLAFQDDEEAAFATGASNAARRSWAAKLSRGRAKTQPKGDAAATASGSKEDKQDKKPNPALEAAGAVVPPLNVAAERLGERIQQAPLATVTTFTLTVNAFTRTVGFAALFVGVVLLLFIIHQLGIWFDQDPELAFDQAAYFLEALELIWDTFGILLNSFVDVSNAAFIPVYNGMAYYAIEPVVVLTLEVFSLIFVGHSWNGIVDEKSFPYAGMDCLANAEAAQWCGRYQYYENKLLTSGYTNDSLVFGTSTARRLNELSGDDTFVTPQFDMRNLTTALDDLTTLSIAVGAPVADVGAGVLDEVMISQGKVIFDLLMTLIRELFEVFKFLVKSGLLQVLIGIGIDYYVILYIHWQLPLLIAAVDFISCIINLFMPSSWADQLKCATLKCFNGADGSSDLLLFTSVPVVVNQFGRIMDATLNSNTGRRCV